MLLVEINGALGGLVANNISMGEILGDDTATGFLFLGDLVTVTLPLCLVVLLIIISSRCSSAGNFDFELIESGVIKEQGGLCSRFLLEGYSC
jgi:hypothetical protein